MSVSPAADSESRQGASLDEQSAPKIPADAANRKRRTWGCAILILLALATPILLLFGGWLVVYWSGESLAKEALAKAKAAGDPTTVREMEAYYPNSPEIEAATAHWRRATEIVDSPKFGEESVAVPILGPHRSLDAGEALPPEDLDTTLAFLDRHREAIEAAHAARKSGAVARFPIEFAAGMAALLPDVQAMRGVAGLLELDLKANLAQGNVDAAVDDLLSMVAASESLSNQPITVSQLVRIAILGVAVAELQHLLQTVELSDERLAELQEAFARQDFHAGLRRAFRGEQWMLIHTLDTDVPTGDANVDRMRMLPLRGADLAKGLELYRRMNDASDAGMLEALEEARRLNEEMAKLVDSPIDRLRYPLTPTLVPIVEGGPMAALTAQANARLAETAIACERFRLARGEYPAKLKDLVPEFLGESPVDPFDEEPLRYAVDEAGATLYSIGRDQIDDGGLDEPGEGDLVFRLDLSKENPHGANSGETRNDAPNVEAEP